MVQAESAREQFDFGFKTWRSLGSVGNVKILYEWKKMNLPEAKGLQLLRLVPDGGGVEHRNVVDRDALLDQ